MGAETTKLLSPIELPVRGHARPLMQVMAAHRMISTRIWRCLICLSAKSTVWNKGPNGANISMSAGVCGADFFFAQRTFALLWCVP